MSKALKKMILTCLSVGIIITTGCSKNEVKQAVFDMPLLRAGQHLGVHKGFEKLSNDSAQDLADYYYEEAAFNGMSIAQVKFQWSELEYKPNEFNEKRLRNALEEIDKWGLQPFVNINVIDIFNYMLPADLMNPNDQQKTLNGMKLNDPIIMERYKKLLDWAVPIIKEYDGFLLSIGNEVDTRYEKFPDEGEQIKQFLAEARKNVHKICPEMGVTITLRRQTIEQKNPWLDLLVSECDVALFNFYGCDSVTLINDDISKIPEQIEMFLEAAKGKQVMFQELGCPSGYEDKPSKINGSPEKQKEWFKNFFAMMDAYPQIRGASLFLQTDFSAGYVKGLADMYVTGVQQDWMDKFIENSLCIGLIEAKNASVRPSWDLFVDQCKKLAVIRGSKESPFILRQKPEYKETAVETKSQDPNVFIASQDFSNTQGDRNWYYYFTDGKEYSEMTYWEDEKCWYNTSASWCRIYDDLTCTDKTDPVRCWVAPKNGKIAIQSNGNFVKYAEGGDGCTVSILKNKESLWNREIDSTDMKGVSLDIFTDVTAGDRIYFIEGKIYTNNYDSLYYDVKISYQ